MNSINKLAVAGAMVALAAAPAAAYEGWPQNYEGVMYQAFYWDSYTETKWTNLTSQADELSQYFNLIWVPNSAQCSGGNNMGYMPVYWFPRHHSSSFGRESELKTMIQTFKEKGTGFIADVVINHRAGNGNWYNFPAETWRGKRYQLTEGCITSGDEVWKNGGHGCPESYKGGPDTGDDFDGARDLDHNNETVQEHCIAYQTALLEDLGYVGFRLDMVKGYTAKATKKYNEATQPQFSVGEYWDSYGTIRSWILSGGKTSAAFDFPLKYALRDAFQAKDMTKLVTQVGRDKVNQPNGVIKNEELKQFAVTFVDNHDTATPGTGASGNEFKGDIPAANAFILCSPGTPCVFMKHWLSYKDEIKRMIDIRKAVGIHNMSQVLVLRAEKNVYQAEVTGTRGTLVVSVGTDLGAPVGYGDADVKASGNQYKIWTKVDVDAYHAGIDDIPADIDQNDGPAVYYNLQGVQVTPSAPGIYIKVQGNKSSKIIF